MVFLHDTIRAWQLRTTQRKGKTWTTQTDILKLAKLSIFAGTRRPSPARPLCISVTNTKTRQCPKGTGLATKYKSRPHDSTPRTCQPGKKSTAASKNNSDGFTSNPPPHAARASPGRLFLSTTTTKGKTWHTRTQRTGCQQPTFPRTAARSTVWRTRKRQRTDCQTAGRTRRTMFARLLTAIPSGWFTLRPLAGQARHTAART